MKTKIILASGSGFCRAVDWILAHENLTGAVNLASPHPVTNAEFAERAVPPQRGIRLVPKFGAPPSAVDRFRDLDRGAVGEPPNPSMAAGRAEGSLAFSNGEGIQ